MKKTDWDRINRQAKAAKDLSESQKRSLAYEAYLDRLRHKHEMRGWGLPKWLK